MSKTTLDLSTLPDIADGAHTVKVKAKADGYIDSEFSNEVSYTKAPAGYEVTLNLRNTTSYYAHVTVKVDGVLKVKWDIDSTQTSLGSVTDGYGNKLSVPVTLHGSTISLSGSMGSAIKVEQNIDSDYFSSHIYEDADFFNPVYTVKNNGTITITNINYNPNA